MNNKYELNTATECYVIAIGDKKTKKSKSLTPVTMVSQNSRPVLYLDRAEALAACESFKENMDEQLRVFRVKTWKDIEN